MLGPVRVVHPQAGEVLLPFQEGRGGGSPGSKSSLERHGDRSVLQPFQRRRCRVPSGGLAPTAFSPYLICQGKRGTPVFPTPCVFLPLLRLLALKSCHGYGVTHGVTPHVG